MKDVPHYPEERRVYSIIRAVSTYHKFYNYEQFHDMMMQNDEMIDAHWSQKMVDTQWLDKKIIITKN